MSQYFDKNIKIVLAVIFILLIISEWIQLYRWQRLDKINEKKKEDLERRIGREIGKEMFSDLSPEAELRIGRNVRRDFVNKRFAYNKFNEKMI